MLRVIAGSARGVRLETPKGTAVRPTLDRVREALFSILMPRIAGARFADLFAGSGANGIEALSRGAERCVFIDNDPRTLATIAVNLERARLGARAECHRLSLPQGLDSFQSPSIPFDVVYADPPFAFPEYPALLERLAGEAFLAPQGLVVLEHAKGLDLPESCGRLRRTRQSSYGTVTLSFFA